MMLPLPGCSPLTTSTNAPAGEPQQVTGRERLHWNQEHALSGIPPAAYAFAVYVDNVRTPLQLASCVPGPNDESTYSCSAPLPSMTAGRHVLELVASASVDGRTTDSARSAPLVVEKVGSEQIIGSGVSTTSIGTGADRRGFTSDRTPYRATVVAQHLTQPSALALTGRGQLWVAERAGTIKWVLLESMQSHTALQRDELDEDGHLIVHGLALHPSFERNGLLFILYTVVREADAVLRLVRLRHVDGRLGERIVLLDEIASGREEPSAALTIGADGKLYIATGADPASEADREVLAAKTLRLNDDGTAATNPIAGSPIFGIGAPQPLALAWGVDDARLWVIDRSTDRTRVDGSPGTPLGLLGRQDAAAAHIYRGLAWPAVRGHLFIASRYKEQLERVRHAHSRWRTEEVLLNGWFGRLGAIAEDPNGCLYVGSLNGTASDRVGRDVVVQIQFDQRECASTRELGAP
jgi:glucose/arabinose dehydrogenase